MARPSGFVPTSDSAERRRCCGRDAPAMHGGFPVASNANNLNNFLLTVPAGSDASRPRLRPRRSCSRTLFIRVPALDAVGSGFEDHRLLHPAPVQVGADRPLEVVHEPVNVRVRRGPVESSLRVLDVAVERRDRPGAYIARMAPVLVTRPSTEPRPASSRSVLAHLGPCLQAPTTCPKRRLMNRANGGEFREPVASTGRYQARGDHASG